jgi:TnpA family transposase
LECPAKSVPAGVRQTGKEGVLRDYPTLVPLIGGKLNLKLVRTQWEEILRIAASVRHSTVTASLIIRKLASYPRQNSLHTALREVGRIERSLFMLEWMKDPELRRRVQVGLNKGEARNSRSRRVPSTGKVTCVTAVLKANAIERAVST